MVREVSEESKRKRKLMRIEILSLVLSNDSKVSGDDFEGDVHRGSGGFRILELRGLSVKGTFTEHLVCTQRGSFLLSKGSLMESTTVFPASQGVVRPLLSQRASATARKEGGSMGGVGRAS
ncbi:unnamed protein product [Prunus armeniaca]